MTPFYENGLVWLRRDLRLADNPALAMALGQCRAVHVAFLFDRDILDPLPRQDRRVEFIRESLVELDLALRKLGGSAAHGLLVIEGKATQQIPSLALQLDCQAVFASHDDEPGSLARDAAVGARLHDQGRVLKTCKDHVVFERQEVLTQAGRPFSVFTPYKRAWLAQLQSAPLLVADGTGLGRRLAPRPAPRRRPVPSLAELGFEPTNLAGLKIPTGESGALRLWEDFQARMNEYDRWRNFPAVKGPSYLGMHLRFGTVSVRALVRQALQAANQGSEGAAVWLSELAWRDFYAQILANFPHVVSGAFKRDMDAITWEEGPVADTRFEAWSMGRTGYPLVDAAMLQLLQTGYMHNRLRMVSASFLVKDLGLDWRRGEAWFATHLNDFDLSSNNGGWQWAASTGCDAQPWFRIFNPVTQSEKFDPQGKFIRRYLPQLAQMPDKAIHAPWLAGAGRPAGLPIGDAAAYPPPIVDHAAARGRTLLRYGMARPSQN